MGRFPDGARVCFIGDSIVHNNLALAHIVTYYREHFPEAKVEFYNCGISGGSFNTTLKIFDEDIRPLNPTHVVIMSGANDSNRFSLNDAPECKYQALENAYEKYRSNLTKLCEMFENMGVSITLCTQMPYAEYIESDEPPLRGGHALFLGYAEFVKTFARDHGYPLCDYHSYATRVMQTESIISPDRLHPTPRGQYHMAKCFLESQGFELGEEKELPADIKKWHDAVRLFRDIIATEHFILRDDFTTTQQERWDAINDYLVNEQTGPYVDYFKKCAKKYLEIKPLHAETFKFTLDFMKNR